MKKSLFNYSGLDSIFNLPKYTFQEPDRTPDKVETHETPEGIYTTKTWIDDKGGSYRSTVSITTFEAKEVSIEDLQKRLTEAVNSQNYEAAIELRDKINELKTEKGR